MLNDFHFDAVHRFLNIDLVWHQLRYLLRELSRKL